MTAEHFRKNLQSPRPHWSTVAYRHWLPNGVLSPGALRLVRVSLLARRDRVLGLSPVEQAIWRFLAPEIAVVGFLRKLAGGATGLFDVDISRL